MLRKQNIPLILILLFGLQACSGNKYISQSATPDFRIDGNRSEWAGRFESPKNEKFAIGMSHDNNYLYLAISSLNRDFERSLAVNGLTLWLDVKGKKRERIGIQFQGSGPPTRRSSDRTANQNMYSSRGTQTDRMRNNPSFNGDLDLIVIDDGRERLGPADLLAMAGTTDGGLFMEYQIPLVLLGENFDIEKTLGIGINSEFDRSNMPAGGGQGGGSRGGGMSGGGGGGKHGGSGGGRGGSGGRPSGMSGQRPDMNDIEVWFKVQLSPPQ